MAYESILPGRDTTLSCMSGSQPDGADQAGGAGFVPTDINTATSEQLRCLVGIGAFYANRIIRGRPYCQIGELVQKHVLPPTTYERMKDQIVAGSRRQEAELHPGIERKHHN